MTDRERAEQYLGIFLNAGSAWEYFIPVDGDRTPEGVRIGSVEVGPMPARPGVWFLRDGQTTSHYSKAGA